MTGIAADMLDGGLAEDLAAASLAVARRFAAGGTMWCVAPSWEPHAHHVAVEFVHPVIVGKRALPAFALTGPDLVTRARVAVRPGDVLIAVTGALDADVTDLMRRSPAWGALSVWIGSGTRPAPGAADHVLWIDDPDPMTPAAGRFVFLYHLLWELTHVCFEHPGLLKPGEAESSCRPYDGPPGSAHQELQETVPPGDPGRPYDGPPGPAHRGVRGVAPPGDYCVTCSDEGRLAEVITPPAGLFDRALVRTADGEESVDVTLVAPVTPGDLLLVHAGTALTRPPSPGEAPLRTPWEALS